jgi:hypothetical protein
MRQKAVSDFAFSCQAVCRFYSLTVRELAISARVFEGVDHPLRWFAPCARD